MHLLNLQNIHKHYFFWVENENVINCNLHVITQLSADVKWTEENNWNCGLAWRGDDDQVRNGIEMESGLAWLAVADVAMLKA